jgi:hypothetical protein
MPGMIRRLGLASAPLLAVACLALPVPLACFGNVEIEACTFTDPTGCDDAASAAASLDDGEVIASGPAERLGDLPGDQRAAQQPGQRDHGPRARRGGADRVRDVASTSRARSRTRAPRSGRSSSRTTARSAGRPPSRCRATTSSPRASTGKNPQVVGTLRRYDKGGRLDRHRRGVEQVARHDWTGLAWLKAGSFGPTGLAVDAEGNIILVGIGFDNDQPRSYVARFHPDGTLDWEKPGDGRHGGPRRRRAAGRHDLRRGREADGRQPRALGHGGLRLRPRQDRLRAVPLQRPGGRCQNTGANAAAPSWC